MRSAAPTPGVAPCGNQGHPVAAATLTALISASADAWERGWRDSSAADPGWLPDVRLPLACRADELYPGTSGLRAFDEVSMQPAAWPPAWPDRREEPELMPGLATLFESRTMIPHRVEVEILAREGRSLLGADESGRSWLDLPPAFDPAGTIGPGTRRQMIVYPVRRPSPADPRATLGVQGVLGSSPADG
jgi:hypothetical protein